MKVGNHDIAAIRQGMIGALDDAMRLFGVDEKDAVPTILQLTKALAATAPLLSDGTPAVTVTIPLAHECVSPIACGGYAVEGEYQSHAFEVTGGLYHAGSAHRYAFACSRNRQSVTYNRNSKSLYGAVYVHRNGAKSKLFLFDSEGNLTTVKRAK